MQKQLIAGIAIAVSSLFVSACGGVATNSDSAGGGEIKIGAIFALTGPNASYGVPEANGAKVLVKSINDAGGVNGKQIKLVLKNGESDPTMAARRAQELISEGVVAIVGATTGSGTLAMAALAKKAEVPIISPAGTSAVTDPGSDYFANTFRVSLADQIVIPAIYKKLTDQGAKRIAVFAQNDAYGQFGVDILKSLAAKDSSGAKVVDIATAPLTATNVAAQATKLRNSKPDGVILQLSSVDLAASFLRAADDIGLDVPIYGGTGMGQKVLLDNAGAAATANLIVSALVDVNNLTPRQEKLHSLLLKYGEKPSGGFGEYLGASGVQIVVDALEKAGDGADGADVAKALNAGMTIDVYTPAPMEFSADFHDGCTAACITFLPVNDGEFTRE